MVGFRMFVAHHAAALNGTVVNRPDGSVHCEVEGSEAAVDRLIALLQDGPAHARVDSVEVTRQPFRGDLPPFTVSG